MFMPQHSIVTWGSMICSSLFGNFALYERLPYDSDITLHFGVPKLVHLPHDWEGGATLQKDKVWDLIASVYVGNLESKMHNGLSKGTSST